MSDLLEQAREAVERRSPDRGPERVPVALVGVIAAVAAAVGALLAHVLDPDMGRTRRAVTADRAAGAARSLGRAAARRGRWVTSTLAGKVGQARHELAGDQDGAELDEAALAHKIESILFRDPEVDKGAINVNAEGDSVFLRGSVDTRERAEDLAGRVAAIDGVGRVVNLLQVSTGP